MDRLDESTQLSVNSDFNTRDFTMTMHNPSNERIKRQYVVYLKHAKRHSEGPPARREYRVPYADPPWAYNDCAALRTVSSLSTVLTEAALYA